MYLLLVICIYPSANTGTEHMAPQTGIYCMVHRLSEKGRCREGLMELLIVCVITWGQDSWFLPVLDV